MHIILSNEKNTGMNCEENEVPRDCLSYVKMVKFGRNTLDEEWRREREKRLTLKRRDICIPMLFLSSPLSYSIHRGWNLFFQRVLRRNFLFNRVHTGVNRINPRNYDFIKIRNVRNKNVKDVSRMKDTCNTVNMHVRKSDAQLFPFILTRNKERQLKHYFPFFISSFFHTCHV